ncbi:MAG: UDP-N-acetylmuramoyl-tripeptide--D-alanyl-D-alanine ligase [Halioglobus sp.]
MMRQWNLAELQVPVAGTLHGADTQIARIATDTRADLEGALFVALVGERFDGHVYLKEAKAAGAVAAVVSEDTDVGLPLLKVADTEQALGRLGAYNRSQFSAPLVAITGSSGKTTVKNMVHGVLSQRGNTLATRGNLNNEIGVPMTLLDIEPQHEFAVVEMGAARSGDIAWLCELAKPGIALLLNALPAHLEGFGSVEDVAEAKGEIYDALGADGIAIINADQPWAEQWRQRAEPATIMDYGLAGPATVTAAAVRTRGVLGSTFQLITPLGDALVTLQFPGQHNVSNALAAAAVGVACGLNLNEIKQGLESIAPVAGRLSVGHLSSGATVVDDCYNANPGSVRAAIDVLADCGGRRTLMLGAMKELGPDSNQLHREIGEYALAAGLDRLWGVGPELEATVAAFGSGGEHFVSKELAEKAVRGVFTANDTILIKGSRSAGMEVLLSALQSEIMQGTQ